MLHKYWFPAAIASFLAIIAIVLVSLAFPQVARSAPQTAPLAQTTTSGTYVWSFAAKFVCGYQPPLVNDPAGGTLASGEPAVKPGNYAVDINIHNPNYKLVPLRKKFIILSEKTAAGGQTSVLEPLSAGPRAYMNMELQGDFATMDDCNNLYKIIYQANPPTGPMPLFIGYMVILSPLDLDVDVVYTASAPGDVTVNPTGISIDVERVTGKRVFLPNGVLPNTP